MFYNINSFGMAALILGQVVARLDDFFQSIGVEHSAVIGKICIKSMEILALSQLQMTASMASNC